MDLSYIGDLLGDFETFAKNTAELFQNLPKFLQNIAEWFQPGTAEDSTVIGEKTETTSSLFEGLSSKPEADTETPEA